MIDRQLTPTDMETVLKRVSEFHTPNETLIEVAKEHGSLCASNWKSSEARSRHANTNSSLRELAEVLGGDMTLTEADTEINERFMCLD